MKEKVQRIIGKIVPMLVFIILIPISVVSAAIHWLYKTIRRIFHI